jgi:hypothetical protein
MMLSRKESDTPRPAGGSVRSASSWSFLPGRRLAALLREIRGKDWASLLERIAPGWSWRAASGSGSGSRGRKTASRTFYPTVDGGLEVRMLLTYWHVVPKVLGNAEFLLKHPGARAAFLKNLPPQTQHSPLKFPVSGITRKRVAIATQTARGGQAVEVSALDGSHYMIKLSYTSNTISTDIAEGSNGQGGNSSASTATSLVSQQNANYPQPIGTVRAYAMPGGRVGIIVDGSTANTDLTINPLGQPQKKGFAHSFAYGEAGRNHLLNIGQLTVTSGQIGAIEGFQVAQLSGPLQSVGTTPIDRIALASILPGASITTGGDLETLDVAGSIDLSGSGTGILVGRDLNLLNVGGGITVSNGANFVIDRNLGLVSQPPKGTGTGSNVLSLNFTNVTSSIITITIPSVGSFIQGNVSIGPGSVFGIGGVIYNTMYIEGSVQGYSRLFEEFGSPTQTNPPFLTSLAITNSTISSSTAPPTQQGPAPTGYVVALQGVSP